MSDQDKRKDEDDNAGHIGINTSGEPTFGIGGGMSIDSDGDLGFKIPGTGLSIDTDGDLGVSI